ncbi:MAG: hypothetical protein K2K75_04870 [Muribaculaceae bacterium]|nr:hypothetical protein [Muribaculaceae bacterium]
MEKDKYLSIEETEQLCRLYMECRLTLLEEAELQYVLGLLPYDSPIIEEVRRLMDISLSCEIETQESQLFKPGKKKNIIKNLLLVAASVVLLLSIGIPIYYHFEQESELYCQVFSNGQEVSKDKALVIAEGELERIDQFFENIKNIESEQQQQIESLK